MSSNSNSKTYIHNSVLAHGKDANVKAKEIEITSEYNGYTPPPQQIDADTFLKNAVRGLEGGKIEVDGKIKVHEKVNVSPSWADQQKSAQSEPEVPATEEISFIVKGKKFSIQRKLLAEKAANLLASFPQTLNDHQVDSVEPEVFQLLLDFIVIGTIPLELEKMRLHAEALLNVANKFKVDNLVRFLSDEFYKKTLNNETAVNYLILAVENDLIELRASILVFIKKCPDIVESKEFNTILDSSRTLQTEWLKIKFA